MAVTQIIGPRIKPMWADPVEWTSTRAYDADTYVTYQGDSYATRQPTPVGIQITNKDYWVKISEFNAQAVAMQNSVNQTLEANETAMQNMLTEGEQKIDASVNHVNDSVNQTIEANETAMQNMLTEGEQKIDASVNHVDEVANNLQTHLNTIDTNSVNINTLQYDSAGRNRKFLWIGDSFSSNYHIETEPRWSPVYHLRDFMKLDIDNMAVDGAGFVGTTAKTFLWQAQNPSKYNKDEYTDIVVYGGNNDQAKNISDVTAAIRTFCTYVIQNYPKARVWYFLDNTPQLPNFSRGYSYMYAFQNALPYAKIFSDACAVQLSVGGYQSTTNFHPSAACGAFLADWFAKCLCGAETTFMIPHQIREDNSNFSCQIDINGYNWGLQIFPFTIILKQGGTLKNGDVIGYCGDLQLLQDADHIICTPWPIGATGNMGAVQFNRVIKEGTPNNTYQLRANYYGNNVSYSGGDHNATYISFTGYTIPWRNIR